MEWRVRHSREVRSNCAGSGRDVLTTYSVHGHLRQRSVRNQHLLTTTRNILHLGLKEDPVEYFESTLALPTPAPGGE